jgi:hypothetical protein
MSNDAVTFGMPILSLYEHGYAKAQFHGRVDANSRIRYVYALHVGRLRQSVLIVPGNGVNPPRHTPGMPPHVYLR